ncbi:MAG TPA: methyltransferase [Rhodospirillaceae bacterium]|nr:methyltransferase [Alphaproteobacteria bacterium]OUT40976.1 MAG: hypothetical protein CBB62_00980 [Micavibrio sp. TMED2]HCI47178.1 methyltransferase [Rhodospirillaceae bacterium]MAS47537.1 methyltransferase [Alphaproteobacteria bacterium]MAX96590.1 methyltransferase [Alphaproteobacteria bacterium]|tara:strand:- start:7656 stop:8348 length:693 start_codon:yes stop_codon:yes gene_type:complete
MSDMSIFGAVDDYIEGLFIGDDPILDQVVENSRAAGLPEIHVSAVQGKFLMLMARLIGAQKILEIGTLAGFSTIWLARGVAENGHVTTLELHQSQAYLAEKHFELAGVADRISCIVGPAEQTLPTLQDQAPFDMIFIDADKPSYNIYLEHAIRLSRPGGLIIADNVIRSGRVLDPEAVPERIERVNARSVSAFNQTLAQEKRVEAIALQQVGAKSHDGFAIIRVLDNKPA